MIAPLLIMDPMMYVMGDVIDDMKKIMYEKCMPKSIHRTYLFTPAMVGKERSTNIPGLLSRRN
jgi:hypothetical protein